MTTGNFVGVRLTEYVDQKRGQKGQLGQKELEKEQQTATRRRRGSVLSEQRRLLAEQLN